MRDVRSADRLRVSILIGLAMAAAIASYWVLQVLRADETDQSVQMTDNTPDYIVDNFTFVRTSTTGQARYDLTGTKLLHYPKGDYFEITAPFVKSFGLDRPPMTMRSLTAVANSDGSRIQMHNSVAIDRPPSPGADPLHLDTEYLLLLPDDDVMQTDQAIDFTLGSSHVTGIGMFANNATRELHVLSKFHGVSLPRTK